MPNFSKIRAILEAWLDYIYLEDLSNAEIEVGKYEKQKVWDKENQLIGDRLNISQSVFQQLKKKYRELAEKGKQQEFKIAVAFPQIYRVEKGERLFKPLFTIEISSIFSENYKTKGWDLTSFEFQPVIPNLIELYRLDEEEIDKLVIREGLKVFLETTFKYPFSTLQDFLDKLPPTQSALTVKALPYLLSFDFVPYNYNLKKDLQKICSQPTWQWANPSHPAYQYLFGQPQPPSHDVLFLGAFPTDPPNASQASALKHAQENPLAAVIGPPGNGKTTLLLFIPAVQVVKRAYQNISTGIDASNLTLVTSTNNRAVTNVIDKLAAELGKDRFYLEGGRSQLINKQVIPKLQTAIDWLETETFNESEWQQTSQQILTIVNELQSLPDRDRERFRQRERDLQDLGQLEIEIQSLNDQIEDLERQFLTNETNYSQYPQEAYERILPMLERAIKSLPSVESKQLQKTARHWWERSWDWLKTFWLRLTKTSTAQIMNRLQQEIKAPLTATLATPFPFRLPRTRESLEVAYKQVAEQLTAFREWHFQQQTSAFSPINSLIRRLDELNGRRARLSQRLASYKSEDFYTRYPKDYHQQQQHLFKLSWQYLQQEALRRKKEVIASLKTYIDVISSEWDYDARRRFANNWSSILRDVSLLFPVFASTLQSVRNLLPYPDSGCIDCTVIDEAGMIPLHQAFPVLVRSRQAIVVGDPLQLEPIVSFSQQTIEQYEERAFKGRSLSNEDYERYSPTSIYTATVYHRAAGATGALGDLGKGILLDEHYRCVPSIIEYCDRISGYRLVIKTAPKVSKLGANLIAYHVEGTIANHINPKEVEAVERIIEHLLDRGYSLDSIGIISPYRAQADALFSHLLDRYPDFNRDRIGTVHTFQGGEKSAIILSTRQCRDADSLQFINRRPNLLNTAVSRARELLILVGNLERLRNERSYMGRLVEHIQQHGEIRELPRTH